MPGTLVLILEVLMAIAFVSEMVFLIFSTTSAREKFRNLGFNAIGGALDYLGEFAEFIAPQLDEVAVKFASVFSTHGKGLSDSFEGALDEFAQAAFTKVSASLEGKTNITPDQWKELAATAMSDAVSFGLGSLAVSSVYEFMFPKQLNSLNSLGPMLATLAGFEEVTKAALGPLLGTGIGKPAHYDANAKFRSTLPTQAAALNLFARGLIDAATRDQLVAWNGLAPAYEASAQTGAYHGYSPRMLLRVIESNLFSSDEINDELTFSGMRPVSQARMLKAAPYLATATYRSQLHATIEKAYVAGILDDQGFKDQMDLAETDTDRDSLTLYRARIEKRLAIIKEMESAYTTQYVGHLIDQPTYEALLQGLGVGQDRVNSIMAIAEARRDAMLERQVEAAERLLEKQTISDLRKAALRNFRNGTIDAAGLAAALIATGLSTVQAAAWVDLAVLEQAGASSFLYGQLLSPSERKSLQTQVAAIGKQVTTGLIDLENAARQLGALKIDATDAHALLAKWAAAIAAPTKHGLLLDAVTGKPPGL